MMLLASCCLVIPAVAQIDLSPEKVLPAAPPNHVLDQADVFREKPEQLAELSATLASIQQKHGYQVYFAVYYNILDGSVQGRADELYRAWLKEEKRGLVIVIQRDPAVDGQNVAASYFQGTGLERDSEPGVIPDREMNGIIRAALGKRADSSDPAVRCNAVLAGVEEGMDDYFAIAPAKWSDAANLKMMAVLLGVIAVLAIGGWLVWRRLNASEEKSQQYFTFPMVDVAQRLGAPYGGGWGSEKRFQPSSSKK